MSLPLQLLRSQKAHVAKICRQRRSLSNVQLHSEDRPYSVGFIGAGNMAYTLCSGFVNSGLLKGDDIIVSCNVGQMFPQFRDQDISTTMDNAEILKRSRIVFLTVKPNQMEDALSLTKTLNDIAAEVMVSVLAGVTIESVRAHTNPLIKDLLRVMPNTPCQVQKGAIALSGTTTKRDDLQRIVTLFQSCGLVEQIPETLMDGVCGFSGSGPAFVYAMIEAMSDAAVKQGIPRDVATKFSAQTFLGSAQMVLESGLHLGQLKDAVTSPGGTTISGIHAMEKAGVRAGVMDAVQAASDRSRELGKL